VSPPVGWAYVAIGDLCSLNNGRAFKPTEWSNNGLPIVRIQNLNDPEAKFNHFEGGFGDRYHLKGGELLFAWSGTPGTSFGAHVWRGGEALLNQHIFRVDFNEKAIEIRFFRYAINQKLEELIGKAHGGVGLRHVTKGKFEQTEIAVPPRSEQTRVADKLESLLSKIGGCREQLERVPRILKKFREAVLEAAVSGKLTEEWRGKRPLEWQQVLVSDAGIVQLGRQRSPKDHSGPHMRPYLRVANVYEDRLNLSDVKEMNFSPAEYAVFRLLPNDILLNEGQSKELVGRPAMYRGEIPGACFQNTLIRFRAFERVHPAFALIVFRHYLHSGAFQRVCKWTTNIAHLGANRFAEMAFPLPTLEEQSEVVGRVDALLIYANSLERQFQTAVTYVETLLPSVLAKAFRGELVPQDPNDEPAGEILERIKAERQGTPEAVPSHGKPGSRTLERRGKSEKRKRLAASST
jgi:type I restriction enzyme S subunit